MAAHPWLRDEQRQIPLDMLIFKLIKSYLRATPLKRAALKVYVNMYQDFDSSIISLFVYFLQMHLKKNGYFLYLGFLFWITIIQAKKLT